MAAVDMDRRIGMDEAEEDEGDEAWNASIGTFLDRGRRFHVCCRHVGFPYYQPPPLTRKGGIAVRSDEAAAGQRSTGLTLPEEKPR